MLGLELNYMTSDIFQLFFFIIIAMIIKTNWVYHNKLIIRVFQENITKINCEKTQSIVIIARWELTTCLMMFHAGFGRRQMMFVGFGIRQMVFHVLLSFRANNLQCPLLGLVWVNFVVLSSQRDQRWNSSYTVDGSIFDSTDPAHKWAFAHSYKRLIISKKFKVLLTV